MAERSEVAQPYRVGNHSPINIWHEPEGGEKGDQIAVAMSPAWATHIVTALNEHHGLAAPNQTAAEPAPLTGDLAVRVRDAIRSDEEAQADSVDPDVHQPSEQYLKGYKAATERAAEVVMEMAWEEGWDDEASTPSSAKINQNLELSVVDSVHESAEPVWKIEVDVPMRAIKNLNHVALFTAVADVAHAWEPTDRDGWDVSVTSGIWALDGEMDESSVQPVVDSELRDRIADAAFDALEAKQRDRGISPIQTQTDMEAVADAVLALVAPVLADRDGLRESENAAVANLNLVLWLHAEAAWYRDEAVKELNLAVATRQQYAEERDAAQASVRRLLTEANEAATALSAIATRSRWEFPPSLGDRIELVASELKITRRQRDAYKDLLGELNLYVAWRYVTKQLTTEQKEMWADAVQAWNPDPSEPVPERSVDRWWRDDSKETPVGLHSVGEIESQRVVGVGSQPDSEPPKTTRKKDCFHPWPGCNCPEVEVVVDQPGGGS